MKRASILRVDEWEVGGLVKQPSVSIFIFSMTPSFYYIYLHIHSFIILASLLHHFLFHWWCHPYLNITSLLCHRLWSSSIYTGSPSSYFLTSTSCIPCSHTPIHGLHHSIQIWSWSTHCLFLWLDSHLLSILSGVPYTYQWWRFLGSVRNAS